ncbi:MAG TPA: radical SAM protein [Anaerolineales bacterium]|nr:radical SAM protein [Anaerolineales bacterium]
MIDLPLRRRAHLVEDLPTQVYIEVTNRCNSTCVSCPLTYDHFLPHEPKRHLSWADFRRIVDGFPRLDRVVLHGIGEPLLNKDLPRFVDHLKGRGAEVLFNTNAILLDQKRGDALAAAGLDQIRVSIDAVTPDLYARLRGVDALPQIIRNLRAFVDRHGGRTQPRVSLWWVTMQANLPQLPEFVRLAADIGISEIYMQRLVYFGGGETLGENTTMKAEQSLHATLEQEQARQISQCEVLAATLGLAFRASGATTPSESISTMGPHPWQGCMRPWILMYISANGTALPCCVSPFATDDYARIMLGNVLIEPLRDVWNGGPYRALRSAVLSDAPAPWPCQYCGVKWSL